MNRMILSSSNVLQEYPNKDIIIKDEDQNGGSMNSGKRRIPAVQQDSSNKGIIKGSLELEELMAGGTSSCAKAIARNKHKEAERRRRNRINAHINTLKSILTTPNPNPNPIKWNKASLLGEAVRRVKELEQAMVSAGTALPLGLTIFPSEADHLSVGQENHAPSGLIKVMFCCEDRPELVVDLVKALKSISAKVVKAEMSTIGGRSKMVVWVMDGQLGSVKRAVKMVLDK